MIARFGGRPGRVVAVSPTGGFEKPSIASGTVQSVNSLKGAVLVQGVMLAMMLRQAHPHVPITEAHPKALLLALRKDWKAFSERFVLDGPEPSTEHERDALIAAVAVREGSLGRWKLDLALHLGPSEIDPKVAWFGAVHYWWPAEMIGDGETPKTKALVHVGSKPWASANADFRICPECHHVFQGKGWGGMDAHWKAKHEHLLPYTEAWPLIKAGKYKSIGEA